jgi:hypothetical protein
MIIHFLLTFAIIIALALVVIFLPIIWWESNLPYSDELKNEESQPESDGD